MPEPRVALVTGAAQGIGFAYASALAAAGHRVALADVDPTVEAAASKIDGAVGVAMDVADEASVEAAVAAVESALGPPSILVNNAALFVSLPIAGWQEIDVATWDKVMAVNLRGPFLCARRVLPAMIGAGWGRIVNIASTTCMTGGIGRLHYVASKNGVIGFTRALAREVGGGGVTVNAIAPGGTQSEGILRTYSEARLQGAVSSRAIKRAQVPDDLVGTLLYLASDAAAFVTGQTIAVDGGQVFL